MPDTPTQARVAGQPPPVSEAEETMPAAREVLLYFLLLGFINVGGPVAQITMMFNQMVERRHWLSQDRFVKIMAFAHMLPGPEALQLAIYVGYLKRRILGGILAGLTFIIPGAAVMVLLSWLYVTYGSLPQVNDALYILKPAVLGIIAAGIIKLGRAAIKNRVLAGLLVGAIVAMWLGRIDFLLVLLAAGLLNMLITEDLPRLRTAAAIVPLAGVGLSGMAALAAPQWLEMIWVFLKTGLFSFGGAYASLAFLQRDAVERYHWLTAGQLLDGVALSVATPGPFMLFTAFAGYLAGGLFGAILATFFVFLPSFVLVLIGAPYIEQVRHDRRIQGFLAGASAAVVGVILVVSLPFIPEAFVDLFSIAIGVIAFLVIVVLKVDVALVAVGAMVGGIAYAAVRALAGGI
ncbi:MAG TPA: chromate efflux transporter [Roseiflexaceae bacterium]|nr:chromate efflux transporter [Roseiflexaceae bacterium]